MPSGLMIACFGLTLTAAAWLDVLHRQSTDREAEIERIHRENSGLARAFEEHVRRVVQSADNALLYLKYEYEANGRVTEGIVNFVERTKRDPILNQIALADSRGDLLLSACPTRKPINIAEREHFQVHATGAAAGLYIGKPVVTQASGNLVVLPEPAVEPARRLLRRHRLRRPQPAYFSNYYDNPEIGPDRAVLLVGRDGIVRARRFQKQSEIGQDISDSPMFKRIDREPAGHHEVVGSIDSLRRFASYRALPDFPLIVAVSDLTSSALAPFGGARPNIGSPR